jgi:hypothetical protein
MFVIFEQKFEILSEYVVYVNPKLLFTLQIKES